MARKRGGRCKGLKANGRLKKGWKWPKRGKRCPIRARSR